MKECRKCKLTKSVEEFNKDKWSKDGLKIYCKPCVKGYNQNFRDNNVDYFIVRKYGVTEAEYTLRMIAQNYVCAICLEAPKDGRKMSIDHDHSCCPGDRSCGKCVRRLLCQSCNLAMGHLQDDPKRMRRAAALIEKDTIRNFAHECGIDIRN